MGNWLRSLWQRVGDIGNIQFLCSLAPAGMVAAVLTWFTSLPLWLDLVIAVYAVPIAIIAFCGIAEWLDWGDMDRVEEREYRRLRAKRRIDAERAVDIAHLHGSALIQIANWIDRKPDDN